MLSTTQRRSLLLGGSLLAVGLWAPPAAAQPGEPTVAELVDLHREARGGAERLAGLRSLRMEGVLITSGQELPLTILRQRPNRFRTSVRVADQELVTAWSGETGWTVNPLAGIPDPVELEGAEAAHAGAQSGFLGVLLEAPESSISYGGRRTVEGIDGEVHVLAVELPGEPARTVYLGVDDHLIRGSRSAAPTGHFVEMRVTGHREVDGLVLASGQTVTGPEGAVEYRFDAVELNPEIDETLFLMPGQEADATLTLEEVLARHGEARLGAAAVDTVRATGQLGLMGLQVPLTITIARPSSVRLEADMAGTPMVLAYDGETAWTVSPLQGMPEPEALAPDAAEAIELFAAFLWGLLGSAQEAGSDVVLHGIERVETDETYHLTVGGDEPREIFLGGEDFLERKVHLDAVFMGREQSIDALLDDYRLTDGLQVPFDIRLTSGGAPLATVALDAVETGVDVDPELFRMPPTPADEGM